MSALPVPTITWARLDKDSFTLIKTSQSRSIIIDGFTEGNISSSLVFSSLSSTELGHYSCNASNILGWAATSFSLRFSPQSWSSNGATTVVEPVLTTRLLVLATTILVNRLARA